MFSISLENLYNKMLRSFLYNSSIISILYTLFFDIFSVPPTVKQPLSVSLYRGVHIQSKIHPCLTILSFITIFSHQVFILLGIPQTHFSIYAEVSVYTRARSTPVIPYRYFSNTAFFGCWNLAEDCAPQFLTFSINI